MGLRFGGCAIAVAAVLLAALATVPPMRAQGPARVAILYDLGDGTYDWSDVVIPDPAAPNASWDATLAGAARHGLRVEWAWDPSFGVGVLDIGDRDPPAGYAGLFVWNASAREWDRSSVGISGLVLADGDAIAWYNAAFDGADWSQPIRRPVPRPSWPTPAVGFRAGAGNAGLSATSAPNGAHVLWDADVGVREIVSTPAVAFGNVYFATFDGLVALDASTGHVRWMNPVVKGFSSPAAFDGTVVLGSSDGSVYRLDAATGAVRWSTRLVEAPAFSGITSSPRVAFDRVYIGTLNETGGPGELVSVWVSNGTVAWRHPTASIHYSSPALWNGTLYVGVMGRYNTTTQTTFDPPYGILAVSAASGGDRWFFPTAGPVAASPVIVGDMVVAPSRDGTVYALDREYGAMRWRVSSVGGVSSPAFDGRAIYVGGGIVTPSGGSGTVTALDPADGATFWQYRTNGAVQSSISVADGKVFLSTNVNGGRVYALNATSGTPVWWHVPVPVDYILASPVVSNGTVYAPSDNGHVYAIRDTGEALGRVDIYALQGQITPPEGNLTVAVWSELGRMRGVRLTVVVPSGMEIASAVPAPARQEGGTVEWDFGTIEFRSSGRAYLLVRPVTGGTWLVRANLTYTDDGGVTFSDTSQDAVRVVPPGQGTAWPSGLAIAIAAGLIAAALLIPFILWRRRNRRVHP